MILQKAVVYVCVCVCVTGSCGEGDDTTEGRRVEGRPFARRLQRRPGPEVEQLRRPAGRPGQPQHGPRLSQQLY